MTTGLPKGVYFSHRQLVLHTLGLRTALAGSSHGRLNEGDVYMPITPLFHVHAWGIPYIATSFGLKQVYPGRYVPHALVDLIHRKKVGFFHCVPTILQMVLASAKVWLQDLAARGIISRYAVPERIVLLDALPRTSVGKIDKKVLRRQFAT